MRHTNWLIGCWGILRKCTSFRCFLSIENDLVVVILLYQLSNDRTIRKVWTARYNKCIFQKNVATPSYLLLTNAIFRFLPSFYISQCLLLKILISLPRYMIIYKPLKFKHKDKLFRKADKKLISFNKQQKMALFQLVFAIYYNGCLTSREIWICWLPILCYC